MRKADNLPPSCAVVMNFGNLNFLEPPGPLQVCNGIDLHFLILLLGNRRNFSASHVAIFKGMSREHRCNYNV